MQVSIESQSDVLILHATVIAWGPLNTKFKVMGYKGIIHDKFLLAIV